MSREAQLLLLALVGLVGPAYCLFQIRDQKTVRSLCFSVAVSVVGFLATRWLIPVVAAKTLKRWAPGRFGCGLLVVGASVFLLPAPHVSCSSCSRAPERQVAREGTAGRAGVCKTQAIAYLPSRNQSCRACGRVSNPP